MKKTRREILKTMLTAAGFTILGGLTHVLQRSRQAAYPIVHRARQWMTGILRPPGSLPEKDFLAACIRCYRCQDACEPGAIQFYTERDGALYHTPYVDPAKAGCTLCLKCGPACPTGAIQVIGRPSEGLPEDMSGLTMGSVELEPGLCLSFKAKRVRHEQGLLAELGRPPADVEASLERRGPCGECYMVCPLRNRAIKLEPGAFLAPMIYPKVCVGCGLCEEICRTVVRGDPAIRVVRTRMALASAGRSTREFAEQTAFMDTCGTGVSPVGSPARRRCHKKVGSGGTRRAELGKEAVA